MSRLVLNSLVLVGMVACSGDDGGGGVNVDAAPERVALCTATLTMSGTFTPSRAVDPTMGCQPVGAWSVQVATADKGDCTTVHTNATYSFTASDMVGSDGVPIPRTVKIVNNSPGASEEDELVITGDNDRCTGKFGIVIPNGTQFDSIQLSPATPTFASGGSDESPRALTGTGTYELWAAHP